MSKNKHFMKVIWYSTFKGSIGLVKYEDLKGEIRYGIGIVDGHHEEMDVQYIKDWGAKVDPEDLKKFLSDEP